jgi:hypothetical protein
MCSALSCANTSRYMVLLTRKPHLGRANARIRQVRDGKALCNDAKPKP